MKITNDLHKNGVRILASSIAAISLSSCGGFMAKETNTNSEVIATLPSSEQEVEEAASSALAVNNLTESEPEKKKGLFGRFFNRSKKTVEDTVDKTTDLAGTAADTTASGLSTTTDMATTGTKKITDVARNTPDVVRSTTDTTRKVTSNVANTGASAVNKTTNTAVGAANRVTETAKTTSTLKEPSRPDIVLPDDEADMIDKVPTLTSEKPATSAPALDDDGFLPLTPSPKLPSDEGILVPGE